MSDWKGFPSSNSSRQRLTMNEQKSGVEFGFGDFSGIVTVTDRIRLVYQGSKRSGSGQDIAGWEGEDGDAVREDANSSTTTTRLPLEVQPSPSRGIWRVVLTSGSFRSGHCCC